MRQELKGKVALITGGASGIGEAIAHLFAKAGAAGVVVADIDEERGNALAHDLGQVTQTVFIRTDVSQVDSVRDLIARLRKRFERLDILVCNAGIEGKSMLLHEMPEEEFNKVMAVNLTGTFMVMRYAIPWMLEAGSGTIVTIASALGVVAAPQASAYASSKGGVIQLTRSAAVDYAASGIRINCVCPGIVDTPMTKRQLGLSSSLEEYDNLLDRMAQPAEIAEAVLFLASPRSSFIVGSVNLVDGGKTVL